MTWMLTAHGAPFTLGTPEAAAIDLDDIAHHLALINRFNGATGRPYSVAEHSLLVAELMEHELGITQPAALLAGLMHDAHEAYLGDIIYPVKALLGEALRTLEWRLEAAVQQRYGLRTAATAWHDAIKRADLLALAIERRDLMPHHPADWAVLDGITAPTWLDLRTRPVPTWQTVRADFRARFAELTTARAQQVRGWDPVAA